MNTKRVLAYITGFAAIALSILTVWDLSAKFALRRNAATSMPDDVIIADLIAQQEMASIALNSLYVSILGLVATSAGILFVALTLSETRKATQAANDAAAEAREANKILRDEQRPFLQVVVSLAGDPLRHRIPDDDFISPARVSVTNHGKRPAHFALITEQLEQNGVFQKRLADHPHYGGFSDSPFNDLIFPGETRDILPLLENKRDRTAIFRAPDGEAVFMSSNHLVGVVYRMPGSSAIHSTSTYIVWTASVPLSMFLSNSGWVHPFSLHMLPGVQVD